VVRRALRRAQLVVPISRALEQFYISKGIPEKKLFVAPDGVNIDRFTISESKQFCREKMGLPREKKIVLYSGHLYARKGAHTFAEAAKLLPGDTLCVFVGGTDVNIAAFRTTYGNVPNILILGHRPYQDIPCFLRAADVVVLPNSAKDEDSRLYTSPMKLFEYMASGTPIVASDVPSLREVLGDDDCIFVAPDEPHKLAEGISTLLSDGAIGERIAGSAKVHVTCFSWEKRAQGIRSKIVV
jgi:glycosyltransferase involved in cell wall biosynthesis